LNRFIIHLTLAVILLERLTSPVSPAINFYRKHSNDFNAVLSLDRAQHG
jgi:hypothetical protein